MDRRGRTAPRVRGHRYAAVEDITGALPVDIRGRSRNGYSRTRLRQITVARSEGAPPRPSRAVQAAIMFGVGAFFMFWYPRQTDWMAFTLAGGAIEVYASLMLPRAARQASGKGKKS